MSGSTAGLADPVQGIAISLLLSTTVLLAHAPDLGDLAVMVILTHLSDATAEAILECHRAIERETTATSTEVHSPPTEPSGTTTPA